MYLGNRENPCREYDDAHKANQNKGVVGVLFDFLFQTDKQLRIEEILDRDPQSVAQLFDRGDRGAVVSSADNVVHRGLCDTAHITELVNGDVALTA